MKLLEIRNGIIRLCEKHDFFLRMLVKFVIAFVVFFTINNYIGYYDKISNLPAAIILACICSLLPRDAIMWCAMVVVLINMYELSLEVMIVTLLLFTLFIMLYYRFAPQDGILVVISSIMLKYKMGYLVPMGTGLLRNIFSVIAVSIGTLIFYFLEGVRNNAADLKNVMVANSEESSTKITVALDQIFGNRELAVVMIVMVVATIVVYVIRSRSIDNAWEIAIVAGAITQIIGYIIGYMIIGMLDKSVEVVIGCIVATILGFVLKFFFMNLDYSRTENVQFEDDSYYYYVKAVPKKTIQQQEKTVKHFGNTTNIGKELSEYNKKDNQ
ncbi:hypothetical protein [Lachnobacterium bovis]|uniref:Uncharacterized protein n=1 Tax=Lachnobacterium bovis TaxID=140626 RepID=A0A1H9P094_9FIRM|nr:hypothetical protein [Lachnobacterium bovis]SER41612.1 hypothetical protein SAMN02910429_00032 [Lachnobacterium bovis]